MELQTLSFSLDPREHESFKIDYICCLVNKFYPQDFTDQEKIELKMQLSHYQHDVLGDSNFKKLSTHNELSQWLVKTKKSSIYHLVYRLIVLVLTLPVSTATSERSFSAMKLIKTRLRNKMEDDFLSNSSILKGN